MELFIVSLRIPLVISPSSRLRRRLAPLRPATQIHGLRSQRMSPSPDTPLQLLSHCQCRCRPPDCSCSYLLFWILLPQHRHLLLFRVLLPVDREASSANSPIALDHTPSPPLHLRIYFAVLFFRRGRNYSYSDSTLLRAFGF